MAVRVPTPNMIEAMHYDYERHDVNDRHARRVIPRWAWALGWGVLLVVVAIVWRLNSR